MKVLFPPVWKWYSRISCPSHFRLRPSAIESSVNTSSLLQRHSYRPMVRTLRTTVKHAQQAPWIGRLTGEATGATIGTSTLEIARRACRGDGDHGR